MFPRHVDGFVLQGKCRECSSELVSLIHAYHCLASRTDDRVNNKPYPINQSPIPALNQERKLPEHATEQTILKHSRVGRGDLEPGRENPNLAFAPSVIRGMQQRWGPGARTQGPIFVWVRGIRRTGTRLVWTTSLPATSAGNGLFGPVDPGSSEEEGDDDQRFQDCSDSHGDGGSDN